MISPGQAGTTTNWVRSSQKCTSHVCKDDLAKTWLKVGILLGTLTQHAKTVKNCVQCNSPILRMFLLIFLFY